MYPKAKRYSVRKSDSLNLETLSSRLLLNADTSFASYLLDDVEAATDNSLYTDDIEAGWGDYAPAALEKLDEAGMADFLISGSNGDTDFFASDSFLTAGNSSAHHILYLDFDGANVLSRSGDFWLGASSITIPAFDLSLFGWSGREAEAVNYITNFVREDYAAYDLYVMTTQPAGGEYTTIYVGGSNEWFRPGSSVIGVATYDIGNRDDSNYGFAFSDELAIYHRYDGGSLLNFSEYLANLISHEAAHTFGANHVSDTSALMNPYLPVSPQTSMFGAGTIPNTTATQDTQSLLGVNLSYSNSADDFGNTITAAHRIFMGQTISGRLERRDDMDTFTFTASAAGTVTADINTSVYGNLDSVLQVYSHSAAAIIAQNDDDEISWDSKLSFSVIAGQQYTLAVSSAYSNSSGSYSLSLSSPAPAPHLKITDSLGSASDCILDFGTVLLNSTNTAAVTISNTGTDTLIISQLWASGGYQLSRTSTSSANDDLTIAPNDQLTVSVTMISAAAGQNDGVITIVTNDPNNPTAAIELSGAVVLPKPELTLSGAALNAAGNAFNFGNVRVGQTATQILTIKNDGSDTLLISGIGISGDFTIISGFSGQALTIAPNNSVALAIAVSPAQRQSLGGYLTLLTNDSSEQVVSVRLAAQGIAPVLTVTETAQIANDHKIDFGLLYVGETVEQLITITNTGDDTLVLAPIDMNGGFGVLSAPHGSENNSIYLAPDETYSLVVSFQPGVQGLYDGQITILSADEQTAQVILSGAAQDGALEIVELDATEDRCFDLGSVDIEQTADAPLYRLINHSQTLMTVNLAWQNGLYFNLSQAETFTLRPGQTVEIASHVDSALAARLSDVLTVTTAGPGAVTFQTAITADAYAAVSSNHPYRYSTQSGDKVTVSLSGDALAHLRLDPENTDIIKQLDIVSGADLKTLDIDTRASKTVQLQNLSGQISAKYLNLGQVELLGSIVWTGSIDKLKLADTGENALIDLDGSVKTLIADTLDGDLLRADSIELLRTQNDLAMNIEITQGNFGKVHVLRGDLSAEIKVSSGAMRSVVISKGNMTGVLNVTGDIGKILVRKGDITGTIESAAAIKNITAKNIKNADISALFGIDKIDVSQDLSNTTVTIGESQGVYNSLNALADAVDTCLSSLRGKVA